MSNLFKGVESKLLVWSNLFKEKIIINTFIFISVDFRSTYFTQQPVVDSDDVSTWHSGCNLCQSKHNNYTMKNWYVRDSISGAVSKLVLGHNWVPSLVLQVLFIKYKNCRERKKECRNNQMSVPVEDCSVRVNRMTQPCSGLIFLLIIRDMDYTLHALSPFLLFCLFTPSEVKFLQIVLNRVCH